MLRAISLLLMLALALAGLGCGGDDPDHRELVLTGALVPAANVASSGELRLHGVLSRGFAGANSSNGTMTLDHLDINAAQKEAE